MPEKQLHSGLQYYRLIFLTVTVYLYALQRTLAFDEDKRQIKKKKKNKRLPPKLVPDPPEAVYYRMGSRSSSLKNQTIPSLHSQRNG